MIFVRLMRSLRGSVTFSVTGGFSERFLNLCARGGIPLWEVCPTEEGLRAVTAAGAYRRLRPLAKRTGVRLHILHREGAPFLMHRYRRRWGIPAGAAAFFLLLALMGQILWTVELTGRDRIPEQALREQLAELGVRPGVWKRSIDTRHVERELLRRFEDLRWAAVNLRGAGAEIVLRERTMPPPVLDDENRPANVIAGADGTIRYLEVYNGQPLVQVGDTVAAGDVIVSGVVEGKNGLSDLRPARAKVLAEVTETVRTEVPLKQTLPVPTGRRVLCRRLELFDRSLALDWNRPPEGLFELQTLRRPLKLLGVELPLVLRLDRYLLLEEGELILTGEEARQQAQFKAETEGERRFRGGRVLHREARGWMEKDAFILETVFTGEKDIAVPREIFLKH